MFLGIDIGGTFTDLALMKESGEIVTTKALTTPGELEKGVFGAILLAAKKCGLTVEQLLGQVTSFGHGTTQATNALIERTGAKTGLLTTRGFGDTLLLQRLMGFTAGIPPEELGWYSRRRYPEPIIPRNLIGEVSERVDQAGNVLLPLDESQARSAIARLKASGVEVFAVCLLWSFRNPSHERRLAELIVEQCPGAYVSLSCDVAPVIGEYERTATTVLNSYLSAKVVGYLRRIENLLRESGFKGTFRILNSIGGVMPAEAAARNPVVLLASGPTGGVLGSHFMAERSAHRNVITTDMGGTSFDVGLIVDGKPVISSTHEVGGYHVCVPMVDIRAIGAGGGSIAKVRDGLLEVGPESAGARPGPACYGQGGTRPTVTDANVVLGLIDPENFLGGDMKLDHRAAVSAIETHISRPLGITVEEAAAGIRRVVDSRMADTLREVTINRGHDPREFVLYAYGGAGPLHCASYGGDLGVAGIVVPPTSMVHSAFGAVASDVRASAERSSLMTGGGGTQELWSGIIPSDVATVFADLEKRCTADLDEAGIAPAAMTFKRSIDIRFRRQTHSLIVPISSDLVDQAAIRQLTTDFERAYEDNYGQGAGFSEAGIELTTFRIEATGLTPKPSLRASTEGGKLEGRRRRIFEPARRQWSDAMVYDWSKLQADVQISGPAIIEDPATSIFVSSGQTAQMDHLGSIFIKAHGVQ